MYINIIFQTVYFTLTYSCSLVVSHSYLYIWVNRCSIISQIIKSTSRYAKVEFFVVDWLSWNLALFCLAPRVALLVSVSIFVAFVSQHLESKQTLCSLLTCLDCHLPSSSFSAHCRHDSTNLSSQSFMFCFLLNRGWLESLYSYLLVCLCPSLLAVPVFRFYNCNLPNIIFLKFKTVLTADSLLKNLSFWNGNKNFSPDNNNNNNK